jgi:hypothetical protein
LEENILLKFSISDWKDMQEEQTLKYRDIKGKTGHPDLQIRSQLSKVLASAYSHISIRVVFRPSCRLSSFFPFKDKIPIALRSHFVY